MADFTLLANLVNNLTIGYLEAISPTLLALMTPLPLLCSLFVVPFIKMIFKHFYSYYFFPVSLRYN